MRRCRDCKILHDRTNFYRHSGMKDGLAPYCKPCMLERQRQWRTGQQLLKGVIAKPYGPHPGTVAKMKSSLGLLALSAEPTPVALWSEPA